MNKKLFLMIMVFLLFISAFSQQTKTRESTEGIAEIIIPVDWNRQGVEVQQIVYRPNFRMLIAAVQIKDPKSGFLLTGDFSDIYLIDFQVADREKGYKASKIPLNKGLETSPVCSPDGRYLAFLHRNGTREKNSLSIYDLMSKRVFSVNNGDGEYADPSFSPDGKRLYFSFKGGQTDGFDVFSCTSEGKYVKLEYQAEGNQRNPAIGFEGNLYFTELRAPEEDPFAFFPTASGTDEALYWSLYYQDPEYNGEMKEVITEEARLKSFSWVVSENRAVVQKVIEKEESDVTSLFLCQDSFDNFNQLTWGIDDRSPTIASELGSVFFISSRRGSPQIHKVSYFQILFQDFLAGIMEELKEKLIVERQMLNVMVLPTVIKSFITLHNELQSVDPLTDAQLALSGIVVSELHAAGFILPDYQFFRDIVERGLINEEEIDLMLASAQMGSDPSIHVKDPKIKEYITKADVFVFIRLFIVELPKTGESTVLSFQIVDSDSSVVYYSKLLPITGNSSPLFFSEVYEKFNTPEYFESIPNVLTVLFPNAKGNDIEENAFLYYKLIAQNALCQNDNFVVLERDCSVDINITDEGEQIGIFYPMREGYTVKEPDGYFFVNPVELRKDRYDNPDNLPDSAFLFYYLGHNKTKTLKKAAKFEEGDPQRPAITGIVTGDEITGILNNLEPGVRSLVFTPKLNGQSEAYRVNRALFENLFKTRMIKKEGVSVSYASASYPDYRVDLYFRDLDDKQVVVDYKEIGRQGETITIRPDIKLDIILLPTPEEIEREADRLFNGHYFTEAANEYSSLMRNEGLTQKDRKRIHEKLIKSLYSSGEYSKLLKHHNPDGWRSLYDEEYSDELLLNFASAYYERGNLSKTEEIIAEWERNPNKEKSGAIDKYRIHFSLLKAKTLIKKHADSKAEDSIKGLQGAIGILLELEQITDTDRPEVRYLLADTYFKLAGIVAGEETSDYLRKCENKCRETLKDPGNTESKVRKLLLRAALTKLNIAIASNDETNIRIQLTNALDLVKETLGVSSDNKPLFEIALVLKSALPIIERYFSEDIAKKATESVDWYIKEKEESGAYSQDYYLRYKVFRLTGDFFFAKNELDKADNYYREAKSSCGKALNEEILSISELTTGEKQEMIDFGRQI